MYYEVVNSDAEIGELNVLATSYLTALCQINIPGAEANNVPVILSNFNEIHVKS